MLIMRCHYIFRRMAARFREETYPSVHISHTLAHTQTHTLRLNI